MYKFSRETEPKADIAVAINTDTDTDIDMLFSLCRREGGERGSHFIDYRELVYVMTEIEELHNLSSASCSQAGKHIVYGIYCSSSLSLKT